MAKVKSKFEVGRKVLVKALSLAFSDYKNLSGEIVEVHDEFAIVAVPRTKISTEDLRDLRRDGDRALAKVKISNLA